MAHSSGLGRGNRELDGGGDPSALSAQESTGSADLRAPAPKMVSSVPPRAAPPAQVLEAEPARHSFPVIDPTLAPARRRPALWGSVAIGALLLGALLAVALGRSLWLRTALPFALGVIAGGVWLRHRRKARPVLAERATEIPPRRSLVLKETTFDLERGRGERVSLPMSLPLGGRFGLTLLSSGARDRLVAVITSEAGTMLFGTEVSLAERATLGNLFLRSTVLGNDDEALAAIAPDGGPTELSPAVFARLVAELAERDASCFDRILLSDQHGAPLVLDGQRLFVKDHTFDLSRPLEWRSILFQESFGSAVTLYQGTWVRQSGVEVVLVSLLGSALFDAQATEDPRIGDPDLDVRAIRDQRLRQATASDPPPREQRAALEGMFVVPLRAALDQAPRASTRQVKSGHPQ